MSKAASAVNSAELPAETPAARTRAAKAPSAFRTISEVADELLVPQHVLRFWEGRFPQVKPLKRGGGRRYYRPDDITLLRRIHTLLYVQGYTIKGVQRLLREGGGQLADDIPPPAPEEKAAVVEQIFHDTDEPQLPMPGLGPPLPRPLPPAPVKTPVKAPVKAARGRKPKTKSNVEAQPAAASPDSAMVAEVAFLRLVLRETLAELEALRTLFPR